MTKDQVLRDIVIGHFEEKKKPKVIFEYINEKVSLSQIYEWIKEYKKFNKTTPSVSSGRQITKTNISNMERVRKSLNLGFGTRKLSKQLGLSRTSVRRIIKKLGRNPYKPYKIPALTLNHAIKRKKFCYWWRKKASHLKKKQFMFSDEKLFVTDGGRNSQNNQIYAFSREDANAKQDGVIEKLKNPLKVMVWSGLTENGATEPYFCQKYVNSIYYVRNILPHAKREGRKLFKTDHWVFQQDGAPAHTSDISQRWCKNNLSYFLDKNHWPPNSPDLNPLDYYYWNAVVTRMKRNIFYDKKSFIKEIKRAMQLIQIEEIKKSIQSFNKRVRKVEKNNGRYIGSKK
jgi:hypothetical protein